MSVCWLCPGQASQTPDMFARLAADPLSAPVLTKLRDDVDAATLAAADDPLQGFRNRHAQPLIVLYGLTVATALRNAGVQPALVAGYSVGELTAHAVAGALDAHNALRLAVERASAMDEAAPADCGMLAVRGVPTRQVAAAADAAGAHIAIVNGADHAVLAGPQSALSALAADFATRGAHVVPLAVTVPAHSTWLASAVAPFCRALEAAVWQAHAVPVPRGLDGRPVSSRSAAIEALSRQLAEPIDWVRTLDVARELGTKTFFELGPGDGLTRMVRERFPDLDARAQSEFASLRGAATWLARSAGRH